MKTGKDYGQQGIFTKEMKVDALSNDERNAWSETDLLHVLPRDKAREAMTVPKFQNLTKDKCYWPFTSTGEYNVKTGYHTTKLEEECQTDIPPRRIAKKSKLAMERGYFAKGQNLYLETLQ